MIQMMSLFSHLAKVFFCRVLRSHGIRRPHFMIFQYIDVVECQSTVSRYRLVSENPAHALNSFRPKLESNKLIYKLCANNYVFSPHLDNVSALSRAGCIKKIGPAIFELTYNFLLHWASRHHDSDWPGLPKLSRVWVERDPSFLRGRFCIVVQASQRNKLEPKRLMQ